MVDVSRVGTAQPLESPKDPPRQAPPLPQAAPAVPPVRGDERQAASAGKALAAVSLAGASPQVDFTKLLRGFTPGKDLELSASGFFGSSFVGGFGKVESVDANGFKLDMHVRAPGHDSDKPMAFRKEGDHFVGADGVKWNGSLSGDGQSLTLTNTTKPKERIQLSVTTPGTLKVTTWGFGGDNKPLTVAVKK